MLSNIVTQTVKPIQQPDGFRGTNTGVEMVAGILPGVEQKEHSSEPETDAFKLG